MLPSFGFPATVAEEAGVMIPTIDGFKLLNMEDIQLTQYFQDISGLSWHTISDYIIPWHIMTYKVVPPS